MSHNLLSDRYYLPLSLLYNAIHYSVRRQRRDTLMLAYARAYTVYQGDHSACEFRDSRLWMSAGVKQTIPGRRVVTLMLQCYDTARVLSS